MLMLNYCEINDSDVHFVVQHFGMHVEELGLNLRSIAPKTFSLLIEQIEQRGNPVELLLICKIVVNVTKLNIIKFYYKLHLKLVLILFACFRMVITKMSDNYPSIF